MEISRAKFLEWTEKAKQYDSLTRKYEHEKMRADNFYSLASKFEDRIKELKDGIKKASEWMEKIDDGWNCMHSDYCKQDPGTMGRECTCEYPKIKEQIDNLLRGK